MSNLGRKKIELDWVKLDSYLQLAATKRVCSALLEVSEDTIERRVNEKYGVSFTEYAERKLAPVKLKLVQKALSKALNGDNALLIFTLKNLCHWRDKQPGEEDKTIVHQHKDLSDEELDQKIKHMVSKKKKLLAETSTTKDDG